MNKRIPVETIEFITDTIFELGRHYLQGEDKKMSDMEVNSLVVNITMSNGIITGMFLEGYEYLMTVNKNALLAIN